MHEASGFIGTISVMSFVHIGHTEVFQVGDSNVHIQIIRDYRKIHNYFTNCCKIYFFAKTPVNGTD